ncbi:MAG TPA: AAA family ATPase [Smithellaceae bacterium]|nr:AAA family ATPase [Smithellaceae bacterium]
MENRNFTFYVGRISSYRHLAAFLVPDSWDDWFKFSTMYDLIVFDRDGNRHDIGKVKIGQFGMKRDQRSPELAATFDALGEDFFSLGQDDSYYEKIYGLGDNLSSVILEGLRDVVIAPDLFEKALDEEVMKISLLRYVSPNTVRGQFKRLAQGGARLSHYKFSYRAPRQVATAVPPVQISFEVMPESNPPTNIHVLIGRNGVGKTYLLNLMARALVEETSTSRMVGSFVSEEAGNDEPLFANLVSVTFSAFDPFQPLPQKKDKSTGPLYSYIGLKRTGSVSSMSSGPPMSHDIPTREFINSVPSCLSGAKRGRWRKALEMLEGDPIFREADVTALVDDSDNPELKKHASSLFEKLSSGHKIVLLTITRLVETVAEKTLVLIDEPEAHLHPPLLSAFIRALSNLLTNRNGVAIIATHSPVVLQEVPRNCVWKLRRSGREATAERPEIETFGENVGILTSEIFGLEVTQSGFHKLLLEQVESGRSFDSIVRYFANELGAEAQAIVRALIAARDRGGQNE